MSVVTPIGVAFLHIPKTGGTSIGAWLMRNIPGCTHYKTTHPKLSSILTPNIDFSFTAVRNPWARMVSLYYYTTLRHNTGKVSSNAHVANFEEFIFNVVEKSIEELDYRVNGVKYEYWFDLITPQTAWIDAPIDLIIKTETLAQDFVAIQDALHCHAPLPKLNKSTNTLYTNIYNDRTKQFVAKRFESDIDTFKYSFV